MIAELGLAAPWIAAALSLPRPSLGASAPAGDGKPFAASVRPVAIVQGAVIATAFAALALRERPALREHYA